MPRQDSISGWRACSVSGENMWFGEGVFPPTQTFAHKRHAQNTELGKNKTPKCPLLVLISFLKFSSKMQQTAASSTSDQAKLWLCAFFGCVCSFPSFCLLSPHHSNLFLFSADRFELCIFSNHGNLCALQKEKTFENFVWIGGNSEVNPFEFHGCHSNLRQQLHTALRVTKKIFNHTNKHRLWCSHFLAPQPAGHQRR